MKADKKRSIFMFIQLHQFLFLCLTITGIKPYGFPSSHAEMWELHPKEGWTLKIDAFELWCWTRLLRVSWTARRSNQSILKEINPDIHWKDWYKSSNTLATWQEELTHWKEPWCWERLRAGGEGDDRGGDGWMASLTQWTWTWANSRRW